MRCDFMQRESSDDNVRERTLHFFLCRRFIGFSHRNKYFVHKSMISVHQDTRIVGIAKKKQPATITDQATATKHSESGQTQELHRFSAKIKNDPMRFWHLFGRNRF